jgi:hypothetical protein
VKNIWFRGKHSPPPSSELIGSVALIDLILRYVENTVESIYFMSYFDVRIIIQFPPFLYSKE